LQVFPVILNSYTNNYSANTFLGFFAHDVYTKNEIFGSISW